MLKRLSVVFFVMILLTTPLLPLTRSVSAQTSSLSVTFSVDCSQYGLEVSGSVVDRNGSDVADAEINIWILPKNDQTYYVGGGGTETDASGAFNTACSFRAPPGEYVIQVDASKSSKSGYGYETGSASKDLVYEEESGTLGSFSFGNTSYEERSKWIGDSSIKPKDRTDYPSSWMDCWEIVQQEPDPPAQNFTFTASHIGKVTFDVVDYQSEAFAYYGDYCHVIEGDPQCMSSGDKVKIQLSAQEKYKGQHYEQNYDYVVQEFRIPTQSGEITYNYSYFIVDGGSDEGGGGGSLQADFTWEPDYPSVYNPITFTSTSRVTGGSITSYEWYLGGQRLSSVSGASSWEWSSPVEGNHSVQLVVRDSNNNEDNITYPVEVSGATWFVNDSAMCTSVQQNRAVGRQNSFQYGDGVYYWMELGNVSQPHVVEFKWYSPSHDVVRTSYVNITDPQSQGYSIWSSFAIWDGIQAGTKTYESMMSQPGEWSIHVYVDGKDEITHYFTIMGSLNVTASMDKNKYITGETITVSGDVQVNSQPMQYAVVVAEVYRQGALLETLSGTTTYSDGSFSVSYTVPVVSITGDNAPEDWEIRLMVSHDQYGSTSKQLSMQMLPVDIELVDVKLVQVVETPVLTDLGGSYPYLVTGHEAGVRAVVRCNGWQQGFPSQR